MIVLLAQAERLLKTDYNDVCTCADRIIYKGLMLSLNQVVYRYSRELLLKVKQ